MFELHRKSSQIPVAGAGHVFRHNPGRNGGYGEAVRTKHGGLTGKNDGLTVDT